MNATNFNVKLIQIENVRSKRTLNETTTQHSTEEEDDEKEKNVPKKTFYWQYKLDDNGRPEHADRNKFRWINSSYGLSQLNIYARWTRASRYWWFSFPIRKYCALSCTLTQEWARKKPKRKEKYCKCYLSIWIIIFEGKHWNVLKRCQKQRRKLNAPHVFFFFIFEKEKEGKQKTRQ